jgi:hypothetical protein
MFNLCHDCERLWRELALATAEHLRAEDRLKRAALEHDAETLAVLTPKAEAAAAARERARLAIRQHEAMVHAKQAGPAGPSTE